ncbi:DUF1629 domain-containing protein [Xanthomonas campestris pv. nigromaculans]|nr:DUF1629 domain-containing protein [Xanthomonas campestris pv. nigromaculans]CAH2709803.1 DUF1629 domain-containing protein [Xanthomonas campestris pv. nigromaculans]
MEEDNMTVQSGPKKGEFYTLMPDIRSNWKTSGVVFENEKELLTPPRRILRPVKGGIPPLRQTPLLVYDPKKGKMPRDLEGIYSGYWLVSERLKNVFEAVDPQGFEFAECEFRLPDGSVGPKHYLCDVVRVLDAVDEEASELKVEISDDFVNGKFYDLSGGAKLAFDKGVIGSAHIFRFPYSGILVVCDSVLREAVRHAGIGAKSHSDGLWFADAADQ